MAHLVWWFTDLKPCDFYSYAKLSEGVQSPFFVGKKSINIQYNILINFIVSTIPQYTPEGTWGCSFYQPCHAMPLRWARELEQGQFATSQDLSDGSVSKRQEHGFYHVLSTKNSGLTGVDQPTKTAEQKSEFHQHWRISKLAGSGRRWQDDASESELCKVIELL